MVQFGNILKYLCIFFILSTISCTKGEKEKIISFSKTLMGTEVIIKVCAKDDQSLRNAIEATFTEGERLNMIFSDYEAQSEVSRFSKTSGSGKFFALSEELFEVLEYSQSLSRQSNGAFDVTVGPLSRLWRVARFNKRLPDEKKLAEAIKRSGWKVSIGGQKHPDLPILELANCAVATSGDIEQFLEISGVRYSHLIDPQTGYGLTNRFQVTVIAANGMIADSVASTSLAIGIEHSREFLKQKNDFLGKVYSCQESNL
jgi:thiamine biosynthesis lipoprotein ApbE